MEAKEKWIVMGLAIAMAFFLYGCGSTKSVSDQENHKFEDKHASPQELTELLAEYNELAFNATDVKRVALYTKAVHVNGEHIDVFPRLQVVAQQIINRGTLSAPYYLPFYHQGHNVHMIHFNLTGHEREVAMEFAKQLSNDLTFNEAFSNVATLISHAVSNEDWIVKNVVDSFFAKSILREFVEKLDPHSELVEDFEYKYSQSQGSNANGRRGEISDKDSVISEHPYATVPKDKSIEGAWLNDKSQFLKIEIYKFIENETAKQCKEIYLQYNAQKPVSGLVIDLRRNRGGDAFVVADLADLFIKEGILLFLREKEIVGWKNILKVATRGNELPNIDTIPIMVLLSRFSASSSETFAAALQSHKVALVVGERSFGKGSGQHVAQLNALPIHVSSRSILRLTRLYTYSPLGQPIQLQGIVPDVIVTDVDLQSHLSDKEKEVFATHFEENIPNRLDAPPEIRMELQEEIAVKNRWENLKARVSGFFNRIQNLFSLKSLKELF